MIIDKEFQSLIPPLSLEEKAQLEENIKVEGCRDTLITWQGVLLDGHNRFEICNRLSIPFRTMAIELADRDAAKLWIIRNQFGRRNLGSFDRGELALKMKEIIAAKAKEQQIRKPESVLTTLSEQKPINTRTEIAKIAGVSEGTISKVETILKKGTPEQISKLRSNDANTSINKVFNSIKKTENKRTEEKQTNSASEGTATVNQINCMQFIYSSETQYDLIITDPPYMTDVDDIDSFVNMWLIEVLKKVKDTGRAYVFIGAYPQELNAYLSKWYQNKLDDLTLENILVWTYKNTIGPSPKDKYKLNWQAVLYFKGLNAPALNTESLIEKFTVHEINAPDGRLGDRYHTWQKPYEIAELFIRHSTQEGDDVFDPFSGTGTFLLAAKRLNRKATGCELSMDMIEIAKERGVNVA